MTKIPKLFLCFGTAGLLLGCGPNKSGPSVPSTPSVAQPAEGDSQEPPAVVPPTLDTSSPYDATVAHRLLALPTSVQDKVKACEATSKFYNLGDQICTDLAPTAFTCAINDEFKARLDPTTLLPLDEYLTTKAPTHRLYACTEEGANITMHFYKFEEGVVNYKKLNIAKKAD